MKFNKIIRGHKREANTEKDLYEVLDAGALCTVAFTHQGKAMMIPTSYGRKGDVLYFHGSSQSFMLQEILKNEQICVSVTHLDGIVLAKTLFNTSVNYRSVVLFGKTELVTDADEKLEALEIVTEQVISGRWNEVALGTDKQLQATLVVKFTIESASVKIRQGGPAGDEQEETDMWSGYIPLKLTADKPIFDEKRKDTPTLSKSVQEYYDKHSSHADS